METVHGLTGATLLVFGYDPEGMLLTVTDGDGNVTSIERSGGPPGAIVAPFGETTIVTTDGAGRLVSVTDPASRVFQMTYTAGGLLSVFTYPAGNSSFFEYDATGRLTRDTDATGGLISLARTELDNGFETRVALREGRVTVHRLEKTLQGLLRRTEVLADGGETITLIEADGRWSTNRPDGTTIRGSLSPDPRFGIQSLLGNRVFVTPGGLTLDVSLSRAVTLAEPGNPIRVSQLTDTMRINGRTFESRFDMTTGAFSVSSPEGRRAVHRIDNQGRFLETGLAGLHPTLVGYDSFGRSVSSERGEGDEKRIANAIFNDDNSLVSVRDAEERVFTFSFDPAGRAVSETGPDGITLDFTPDANSNLSRIVTADGQAHNFAHSEVDLLVEYLPPPVGPNPEAARFSHDLDRRLTRITRPDGTEVDISYDSSGRLSGLSSPSDSLFFEYEPATGNLSAISRLDSRLSLLFDGHLAVGRVWSGSVSGSVAWQRDDDFRIVSETVNGGHQTGFSYDEDGLLISAGGQSLTYDGESGLLASTQLGQVNESYSHNPFGELIAHRVQISGSDIYAVDLVRDRIGRIIRKTETVEGVTSSFDYAYDSLGRLAEVRVDGLLKSQYSYDGNGNRIALVMGQNMIEGVYDQQDRLVRYGSTLYEYNPNGELSARTEGGLRTEYRYDSLGNLVFVTPSLDSTLEFLYDGAGQRIGKRIDGSLVQGLLYRDQTNPVALLDGEGGVVARFVYASRSNVPDYMVRGGKTYRFVCDHLGSPRLVLDAESGEVAQRMDYDEFGNLLFDSNPGFQPFGFAGGVWDGQTGSVRFGGRDYDPVTGRWTTKDPVAFGGGDPNLYAYVLNDPINLVDPQGTDWRQTVVDISSGFGDSILFGYGDELRAWTDKTFGWNGSANVDRCSDAYRYSSIGTTSVLLLLGTGRLVYAGSAKGLSYLARGAEEAIQNRNTLKIIFRLGLDKSSRIFSVEEVLRRYRTAEEAIRAAGRTDTLTNLVGAATVAGALNAFFNLPECGCN